jgi:hypothetical protein
VGAVIFTGPTLAPLWFTLIAESGRAACFWLVVAQHCDASVFLIESPTRSNACRPSPVAKYTAVIICIDTGSFMVSMENAWESDFMKILVTGGAGYIGGTVTRLLLAGGHSATVFDNLSPGKQLAVAEGAEFVEGDLADRGLLENTLGAGRFDGVMHFAARIEVAESMQRPEIYFRNNTAATLNLLEAMLATGHDRMVFSSTAACYGSRRRLRYWRMQR